MAFLDYSGLSHFLDKLKQLFLAKDQGSTNAGKFMKVGNDGTLVPDNIPDPSGKADKVTGATAGDVATLDSNGNLVDSGKTLGISVPANAVFTDTTYSAFTGATEQQAGAAGLVPAPTVNDTEKYLKGDGTWAEGASGSAFTDVAFSIPTSGWTLTNGEYVAEVTEALITSTAGIDVFYDKSLRTSAKSDVFSEKGSGKVTFSTDIVPTGALSGTIRIFDGQVALTPTATLSVTATSIGWNNSTPPTQTITANGVTATNNIIVGMGSVTVEQKEACEQANILCTAQGANSITLTAYGTVPEVNIPINVMIVG